MFLIATERHNGFFDEVISLETPAKTRSFVLDRHRSGRFSHASNRENSAAIETAPHVNASTWCLRATHIDDFESDDPSLLPSFGQLTL
jgi:hypothetical protein